ncbi:streptophobe family protein [Streptomyces sp. NPDC085614]|uniref:streptophobe family protein n=1 Tax=Streptomyces sp. NPDC085614 TaxID=3365733 RepID=UPI0037D559D6
MSPTDVILTSIAAVGWALVGMAGAAALGLHLLGADAAGGLGPMTAAVVVLAVGGSVTPTGDVSAYGLEGAAARTAVDFAPLGVALVGALLLGYLFLRSLRGAGPYLSARDLACRVAALVTVFVAAVGGLAWAGHDVVTIDGDALGIEGVPGAGGDGGLRVPGLGDLGGLLPDRLGDLAEAKASVGFSVDTVDSLAGAALWALGVVVLALLASRRAPLPPGRFGDGVRRVVRPAASALVAVGLVAVAAGYAAAGYAAFGDDRPRRVLGGALLGTPNGVGVGVPLGLFVPWTGGARGSLAEVLPDPLDALLGGAATDRPVTVARLAELDRAVWLLAVAAAVMMLGAGVLAASRTPRDGLGRVAFAARCGLRLGAVTAPALALSVVLAGVSVDASLSVLGVDAFDAGVELHGDAAVALLLGAVWGAGAGAVGGLLVGPGRRAAAGARGADGVVAPGERTYVDLAYLPGPYIPSTPYRPPGGEANPYADGDEAGRDGRGGSVDGGQDGAGGGRRGGSEDGRGAGDGGGGAGSGLHAAPTVAGPLRGPGPGGRGRGPRRGRDLGPVVPPPPAPPPDPPGPPDGPAGGPGRPRRGG